MIYRQFDHYDPVKGRLFTRMILTARNKSIDFLRSAQVKYVSKTSALSDEMEMPGACHIETKVEYYFF